MSYQKLLSGDRRLFIRKDYNEMDDNAMAIMEGKPMLVPGEEGLRDIRIVEAIYKSAQTKQPCKI